MQSDVTKKLRGDLQKNELACGHLCDGCPWRKEPFGEAMPKRHPDIAKEEPLYW